MPTESNKVVLYDLKRMMIIDTLTLEADETVLDIAYCQNRQQLYLLIEEKVREKSTTKLTGLSPEKKWMDSTDIDLGKKNQQKQTQPEHGFIRQKMAVFYILDRECRISRE